jgi:hypothetical protein
LQNEAGNIERSDPCLRATYSPAFILYTRLTSYPTTPFSASLSIVILAIRAGLRHLSTNGIFCTEDGPLLV